MAATTFSFSEWHSLNRYDPGPGDLPRSSGVYIIALIGLPPENFEKVLYVGMSKNIKKRVTGQHKILKMCRKLETPENMIQIYFRQFPQTGLAKREKSLIQELDPPFNIIHRKRGI